MAAPPPEDESGRPAARGGPATLDADIQAACDGLVRLAARLCAAPAAALFLSDGGHRSFTGGLALGLAPAFPDTALYAQTLLQTDLLIVPDAAEDARFSQDPPVRDGPRVRFYMGAPLVGADGTARGALCVMDAAPRRAAPDQQEALRALARLALGQSEWARDRAALAGMVADRARAREEMRESEVRLQVITDALPALAAYVDSDQRYRFTNAAYEHWFRRPRAEVLGRTVREVLGEAVYRANRADIAAALAGRPVSYERELTWPDGRTRFVRGAYVPRLGPGGRAEGFAVLVTDLTDRRRVARLLEESEQRHRALFHHHPDAVYSFNLTYEFVSANAACEAVSGFTPAELLGTSFIPLIVPEDVERVLEHFAAAAEGRPQHFEAAITHKGGRRVEVAVTNVPLVVGGAVVGVYGIAKDISARRRAEGALRQREEQLRAVVDQAMDGIFLFDPESWRVLTMNAALREMLGYAEADALTLSDFVADDPAGIARNVEAVLRDGQASPGERRYRRRDGSPVAVEVRARLIRYGDGEAVCAVVHDITARKALESARERTLAEAREQADRDPLTGLLNHRAFHRRLEEESARARREGTTLAVAMLDLDNFKFFNDAYGHITGDQVLRLVADTLRAACRPYDTVARFGGDEFALLLPGVGHTSADEVEARLRAAFHGLSFRADGPDAAESGAGGPGATVPVSVSVGTALLADAGSDRHEALRQADERLRRAKAGGGVEENAQRVRADAGARIRGFPMLDALVTAVDNKDRYTRRHSEDVLGHGLQIARALGLGEAQERTVAVASLLHDVGKIGVPDAILRKPGRLTAAEFEAVRQHPQMGAAIVGAVPGLEDTLGTVRHHHERWDGAGYPGGLRGAETPLLARLVAVADAFSAMTTDRPYRRGMSRAEARAILEAGAGSQWDPECVAALVRTLPPEDEAGVAGAPE